MGGSARGVSDLDLEVVEARDDTVGRLHVVRDVASCLASLFLDFVQDLELGFHPEEAVFLVG